MAGYGWSYLVVTVIEPAEPAPGAAAMSPAAVAPRFHASDQSTFDSEEEMLRELGATGWELVAIREAGGRVVFYFKRPRS